MPKKEMSDADKLELLHDVRGLLAFPDIDDDEWIVEQLMEMLKVSRGQDTNPL